MAMKPTSYLPLLLGALAIGASGASAEPAEVATFHYNFASFHLNRAPDASDPFVKSVDVEFRTSFILDYLFILANPNGSIGVVIDKQNWISVILAWQPMSGEGPADLTLQLHSPGIINGEWRRLSVQTGPNGQVTLDGKPFDVRLPSNFTASFEYGRNISFTVGHLLLGCLANVSLDTVVKVPLHLHSSLLNTSEYLTPDGYGGLPKTGPGCRQQPCKCEPNGNCVYRQWDILDRCNCTRGYNAAFFCEYEWDTCKNLETGPPCLNGATCGNRPGIDEFQCFCATGFVGSRCQNLDYCQPNNPCQNGGSCQLHGDIEHQESLSYGCRCAPNYTGMNCTQQREPQLQLGLIVGLTVPFGIIFLIGVAALAIFLVKFRK